MSRTGTTRMDKSSRGKTESRGKPEKAAASASVRLEEKTKKERNKDIARGSSKRN